MAEDDWPQERLYFDRHMTRPEGLAVAGGRAAVFSACSPAKDTPNEDAAAVIPFNGWAGVLAVADGLGGVPAGEHAAEIALRALKTAIRQGARDAALLRTAILDGLEEANRRVQALGVGAATTIAVIELQETSVRPYHVGDSMILVVGQRGKVKLETISHSPVAFAVEAGFLDKEEAMHHEDRHLVSNVIGSPAMKIEIGPTIKLAPRDTVLLASDGLSDNLHTEEIIERVRKGPIEAAAAGLAADAARRMTEPKNDQPSKPDDLTFILFRRRGPGETRFWHSCATTRTAAKNRR